MTDPFTQTALLVAIALALGLVAGWWIGRSRNGRILDRLDTRLEELRASLEESERRYVAAMRAVRSRPLDFGRPAEAEALPPEAPPATAAVRPQATAPVRPQATAPVRPQATAAVRPRATAPVRPQATAPVRPQATAPVRPERAPQKGADDLRRIWGIGPRMEQLLHAAGIGTYEVLAGTPVERLQEILRAYGSQRLVDLANEEAWPVQAAMAAQGDWGSLEAYQAGLSWKSGGGSRPVRGGSRPVRGGSRRARP